MPTTIDNPDWTTGVSTAQLPAISQWIPGPDLPFTVSGCGSVAYNGSFYIAGGYQNGVTGAAVVRAPINADGSLGAWVGCPALPVALCYLGLIAYDRKLYAIGGNDGATIRPEVYSATVNADGTLGAWVATTALPVGLEFAGCSTVSRRLYVMGGYSPAGAVSTSYYAPINADGTLGAWVATTALPVKLYAQAAIAYYSKMYCIAGYIVGGPIADGPSMNVYYAPINADGTLGAWLVINFYPVCRSSPRAAIINAVIYMFGGDQGVLAFAEAFYADIYSSGQITDWAKTTPMPEGKSQFACGISNEIVYVAGGFTNTGDSKLTHYGII